MTSIQNIDDSVYTAESELGLPISTPLTPTSTFLEELEGRRIYNLVCGKNTIFCLASEDTSGCMIGEKLYRQCQVVSKPFTYRGGYDEVSINNSKSHLMFL